MPKIVELTVVIEVQKVSCPGVWLCQDGNVSLTLYALGTSYQTCLLPPVFPLLFKDIFYFKKQFEETCALNNISCLLKDEPIYCELVQYSDDRPPEECVVLAQYLGNLSDVLFPPNMCSNDGVDLLMRRAQNFPGILSPKIEIATKVRIDEMWNPKSSSTSSLSVKACECSQPEQENRQKQVCHSANYHRHKCTKSSPGAKLRCHSSSRSNLNSSVLKSDLNVKKYCSKPSNLDKKTAKHSFEMPSKLPKNRSTDEMEDVCFYYAKRNQSYNSIGEQEKSIARIINDNSELRRNNEVSRLLIESGYIDTTKKKADPETRKIHSFKLRPCVCDICKKYHEFFHS